MIHVLLPLFLAMPLRPPTIATQTTTPITNPTTILWTPSPDDVGTPSPITQYTMDIYTTTGPQTIVKGGIVLGHPTPDSTNTDTVAGLITTILPTLPLGIYTAQICAEEGTGASVIRACSGMSNPFTRQPVAASNPVIK